MPEHPLDDLGIGAGGQSGECEGSSLAIAARCNDQFNAIALRKYDTSSNRQFAGMSTEEAMASTEPAI